jgi:hypothetical protein
VTEEEPRYAVVITKYDPDTGDFKNIDATEKEERLLVPRIGAAEPSLSRK